MEPTITPLVDFIQGSPNSTQHHMVSSSNWRAGENRTVSSILSSPELHSLVDDHAARQSPTKDTEWRAGDHGGTPLGSDMLQHVRDESVERHHRSDGRSNPSDWRCGDHRSTPLGSDELERLVVEHRSRVSFNPRASSIVSHEIKNSMCALNNTVAVVGSPTLQRRIAKQRMSPPCSTHLRKSPSSPILTLGSKNLQRRRNETLKSDLGMDHSLGQKFSEGFVTTAPQGSQMSWNDRAPLEEESFNFNYYPPTSTRTKLGVRPTWIAGNQMRPPPKTMANRGSIGWSANATRRANDLDATMSSSSSPSSSSSSSSPTREWRYKKRYFFHKAGKSMLRKAYLWYMCDTYIHVRGDRVI